MDPGQIKTRKGLALAAAGILAAAQAALEAIGEAALELCLDDSEEPIGELVSDLSQLRGRWESDHGVRADQLADNDDA